MSELGGFVARKAKGFKYIEGEVDCNYILYDWESAQRVLTRLYGS